MSGRTLEDAISFDDDESHYSEDEVDVQAYATNDETDELIESDDDFAIWDERPSIFDPSPKTFELPSLCLECGIVRPGTVVELEDHSGRKSKHLQSGDFLLVRSIVENVETENVVVKGYRMRRVECLAPLFDRKLNDLFMLITVHEGDRRPPFVQGLEDITVEEIVQIRTCVFTNLDYTLMGQSDVNPQVPLRLKSRNEVREWVFRRGKLICRWVHIVEQHHNANSYGGEARRMFKREVAEFSNNEFFAKSSSESTPAPLHAERTRPNITESRSRKRFGSVQEVARGSSKHAQQHPQKSKIYTFGDGFSGIGGVSEGARQAGYKILWGLELDPYAMAAYRLNFPDAIHLEMNAHEFPEMAQRSVHGCDHLHMSCPCCFWSQAHTNEGKNDEANILTLYTVEAWLSKLKPRTFSLEQAPGLIKLEKHRMYFRILLNGILNRGYNVRWRVQDQAWFGIAQNRRRLVFVGAKIGTPLPPFPSPTHGPNGSGLKRYVTIEDALRPLQRQTFSLENDIYHQPHLEKRTNEKSFDPSTNLAKTITTSGGDNAHHSGKRSNTCRELAQFQGFPTNFHFTGSSTEAKKQCGNAWSVKSNKQYFVVWAAHLEAFDHGLIDAEDEVLDLYDFLDNKGIPIPKPAAIELDNFGSSSRSAAQGSKYRYLTAIEKTVHPRFPLRLWARRQEVDPLPQRRRHDAYRPLRFTSGFESDLGNRSGGVTVIPRKKKRRTHIEGDDDIIELD